MNPGGCDDEAVGGVFVKITGEGEGIDGNGVCDFEKTDRFRAGSTLHPSGYRLIKDKKPCSDFLVTSMRLMDAK